MIFVATKNGRTKKMFPLLFWYCCWIRDKHPGYPTLQIFVENCVTDSAVYFLSICVGTGTGFTWCKSRPGRWQGPGSWSWSPRSRTPGPRSRSAHIELKMQCYGSGIQCFLTPGVGIRIRARDGKNPDPGGSEIRDKHLRSHLPELKIFWGLEFRYTWSLCQFSVADFGSGMEKSRSWINIDPQHRKIGMRKIWRCSRQFMTY